MAVRVGQDEFDSQEGLHVISRPASGGRQLADELAFLTGGQFLISGFSIGQQAVDAAVFPGRQPPLPRRGLVADRVDRLGHGRPPVELANERQAIHVARIECRLDARLEVLGCDIVSLCDVGRMV